jgi:WGR domain
VSGGACRPILRYQRARGGRAVIQSRQTPAVTISRAGQGGLARAWGTSCRLTRRCLRRPAHDERSDGFIARDGHDIAVYPSGGAITGAPVRAWLVAMSYGRIGTSGRTRTRSFPGAEEARAQVMACLGKRASAPRRIGVAYRVRSAVRSEEWCEHELDERLRAWFPGWMTGNFRIGT